MRLRLIRLLVIALAAGACLATLAVPAGADAGVRLTKITGIPRTFVQAASLHFSLSARNLRGSANHPALTAFLAGNGSTTRARITPQRVLLTGGQRATYELVAGVADELPAGRYGLLVCAAGRPLRKIPRSGCVRSRTFSLIQSVRITTGQGVTIHPTLDLSRAVATTIGSGGGTLSATTSDGSRITLSIPAGALAGAEQLTMIPIAGLPGSGLKLAAGVQISPDGLRLQQPATLTVASAAAVPLAAQTGFSYQGAGADLGLLALAPGRATTIPLLRLGGAGLASGTAGQLAQRVDHPPRDVFPAFISQLSDPLRQLRLRALHRPVSGTAHPVSEVKGELGGFFNQFVEPSLRRAGSSLGAWLTSAQRTLAWERQAQLLGYTRLFAGQQQQSVTTGLGTALATIWGRRTRMCATRTTVGNLQGVMTVGRAAQALRLDGMIGGPGAIDAAVLACARITGQASIVIPSTGWQAADFNSQLSQIVSTVSANGPLVLSGAAGDDGFSYQSPHVAVNEQVSSATASINDQADGCSTPTFVAYSSDPSQMYAAFGGTLTVPDDLFDASSPPWTYTFQVSGADNASWSITCPPAQTPTTFAQSPQAMASLGAITAASPIRLSAQKTSRSFSGQTDLLSGSSITGLGTGHGVADVTLP